MITEKPYFCWDVDVTWEEFQAILGGQPKGRFDREWAALRLMEYGRYEDIKKLLGFTGILELFPKIKDKIRSETRKRGLEFLCSYVPEKHPEWMRGMAHG